MILPTRANLTRRTRSAEPEIVFVCGYAPQGNPRHYKFLWQLFSLESDIEGDDFLAQAPWLCLADFEKETERLLGQGMSCLAYGVRRPRLDPANPWKLDHPRWQGQQFAPAWDQDTDPVTTGGHK